MIFKTSTHPYGGSVLQKPINESQILSATESIITKISTSSNYSEIIRNTAENTSIKPKDFFNSEDSEQVLPIPMAPTTPMADPMILQSSSFKVDASFIGNLNALGYVLTVLIPIILLIGCAVFSIMICYFNQRRKKLDDFRHRLIPVYNFAPEEEDEWGVLLDGQEKTQSIKLQ